MSCTEMDGCSRSKSFIQVFLTSASFSVLFFLFEIVYTDGARSLGRMPCIQALFQKAIFLPFPILIIVAAVNRCLSVSLQGSSLPTQGLPSGFQSRQSHKKWRALVNFPRCRMPKPPFSFDRAALVQFTLHLAPVILSMPAYRNCLRLVSTSCKVAFGARKAIRK